MCSENLTHHRLEAERINDQHKVAQSVVAETGHPNAARQWCKCIPTPTLGSLGRRRTLIGYQKHLLASRQHTQVHSFKPHQTPARNLHSRHHLRTSAAHRL